MAKKLKLKLEAAPKMSTLPARPVLETPREVVSDRELDRIYAIIYQQTEAGFNIYGYANTSRNQLDNLGIKSKSDQDKICQRIADELGKKIEFGTLVIGFVNKFQQTSIQFGDDARALTKQHKQSLKNK
jgi:hypothetical protein